MVRPPFHSVNPFCVTRKKLLTTTPQIAGRRQEKTDFGFYCCSQLLALVIQWIQYAPSISHSEHHHFSIGKPPFFIGKWCFLIGKPPFLNGAFPYSYAELPEGTTVATSYCQKKWITCRQFLQYETLIYIDVRSSSMYFGMYFTVQLMYLNYGHQIFACPVYWVYWYNCPSLVQENCTEPWQPWCDMVRGLRCNPNMSSMLVSPCHDA